MSGPGEALVRDYMSALDQGDEALWNQVLSQEFELIEAPTRPGAVQLRGQDELDRYWRGWKCNWAEWSWTPVLIEEAGDRVLVQADLWLRAAFLAAA